MPFLGHYRKVLPQIASSPPFFNDQGEVLHPKPGNNDNVVLSDPYLIAYSRMVMRMSSHHGPYALGDTCYNERDKELQTREGRRAPASSSIISIKTQHGALEDEKLDVEETCDGIGEEECLMRRTLVAHTDYIYTQKHNP
ncbi:Phytosulfokines 3 [Spatholobus suberectus]|nr:Phytosulfokines 3 [Spatholobus suberectus]